MMTAVYLVAFVPLAGLSVRSLVRAVRARDGGAGSRAAMWGMLLALAGVIASVVSLVRVFGQIANADASSKATELAKGISAAMDGPMIAVALGLVLGFVGGIARGVYGKGSKAPQEGPGDVRPPG